MFIKITFILFLFFSTADAMVENESYEINIQNMEYQNMKYENFQLRFENILFLLNKMQLEYEQSDLFPEFFFNVIINPNDYLDYLDKYGVKKEDITDTEFLITLINTIKFIDLKVLNTTDVENVLYITQSIQILKNDLINQNIQITSIEAIEIIQNEREYLFQSFDINQDK
jgi:hypothetical protein